MIQMDTGLELLRENDDSRLTGTKVQQLLNYLCAGRSNTGASSLANGIFIRIETSFMIPSTTKLERALLESYVELLFVGVKQACRVISLAPSFVLAIVDSVCISADEGHEQELICLAVGKILSALGIAITIEMASIVAVIDILRLLIRLVRYCSSLEALSAIAAFVPSLLALSLLDSTGFCIIPGLQKYVEKLQNAEISPKGVSTARCLASEVLHCIIPANSSKIYPLRSVRESVREALREPDSLLGLRKRFLEQKSDDAREFELVLGLRNLLLLVGITATSKCKTSGGDAFDSLLRLIAECIVGSSNTPVRCSLWLNVWPALIALCAQAPKRYIKQPRTLSMLLRPIVYAFTPTKAKQSGFVSSERPSRAHIESFKLPDGASLGEPDGGVRVCALSSLNDLEEALVREWSGLPPSEPELRIFIGDRKPGQCDSQKCEAVTPLVRRVPPNNSIRHCVISSKKTAFKRAAGFDADHVECVDLTVMARLLASTDPDACVQMESFRCSSAGLADLRYASKMYDAQLYSRGLGVCFSELDRKCVHAEETTRKEIVRRMLCITHPSVSLRVINDSLAGGPVESEQLAALHERAMLLSLRHIGHDIESSAFLSVFEALVEFAQRCLALNDERVQPSKHRTAESQSNDNSSRQEFRYRRGLVALHGVWEAVEASLLRSRFDAVSQILELLRSKLMKKNDECLPRCVVLWSAWAALATGILFSAHAANSEHVRMCLELGAQYPDAVCAVFERSCAGPFIRRPLEYDSFFGWDCDAGPRIVWVRAADLALGKNDVLGWVVASKQICANAASITASEKLIIMRSMREINRQIGI